MISGHITKAVQSVFKKIGVDVRVTSTSFRKATVMAVHSSNPAMSGKLARHITHKTKESVETSKELGSLMRCDGEKNPDPQQNSGCESREKEDGTATLPAKTRDAWDECQLDKLKAVFGKQIAAKQISMAHVRNGIESNKEVLDGMSPRRVYDKVRRMISEEPAPTEATLELPQACESLADKVERIGESNQCEEDMSTSLIPPSERNSSFNNEEINSIHILFKDMIMQDKRICRVEIEERLSSTKDGRKILNKLSVQKVLNRIKYERLKKRRQEK